jgi:hypothetical protein
MIKMITEVTLWPSIHTWFFPHKYSRLRQYHHLKTLNNSLSPFEIEHTFSEKNSKSLKI